MYKHITRFQIPCEIQEILVHGSTQNLQCSAQNLNPISKEGMLTQHCTSVFAIARALNPHSSIAFTVSSMVVRLFWQKSTYHTNVIILCEQ